MHMQIVVSENDIYRYTFQSVVIKKHRKLCQIAFVQKWDGTPFLLKVTEEIMNKTKFYLCL